MVAAAVHDLLPEQDEDTGVHLTRRSAILRRLAKLVDRLDQRLDSERPPPPPAILAAPKAPPCTLPPPTLADVELAETIDIEPDAPSIH